MEVRTRRMTAGDQVAFDCGKHSLNDYFARHALDNDAQGIGRTYVWPRNEHDDPSLPDVLGYYTLSMAAVESEVLATALGARLPRYPMPVALIGRFALARSVQGRGLGTDLLGDALMRVVEASELIGCLGVLVDALDAAAEHSYAKHGFATLREGGWPRRMFLGLETIRAGME